MRFVPGQPLPRRTFLRSMGATVALPYLDAMIPVGRSASRFGPTDRTRFVAIEMVHGAAGSNELGAKLNMWAPAATGRKFDLSPSALQSLDPWREYLTIISNTDVREAEPTTAKEIGGDHFRSSAVYLTQCHPKQTEGSDVKVGTSLDQMYAQRFGQETPIPSMQLCIEPVDQAGGCAYGYACVYTDTISWASPTEPLPMIRDPRMVFEQLFGSGGTPEQRAARRATDKSILDMLAQQMADLRKSLGPTDRQRLEQYGTNIREIEQRIARIEARNTSGDARELPGAPAGVPDSFEEHVKLMFDLQVLAFSSDTTRVFSFKIGRDGSGRVYPGSGVDRGFHDASHHGASDERIKEFAAINRHHVSMLPYFLEKLKTTSDGEASLLDKTLILYGSPMAVGNTHNHRNCPLILLGGGGGVVEPGVHIKAQEGTPMANVMLTLLNRLGLDDLKSFGDSSGEFSFTAPDSTVA